MERSKHICEAEEILLILQIEINNDMKLFSPTFGSTNYGLKIFPHFICFCALFYIDFIL